jgi:hypothetical protein
LKKIIFKEHQGEKRREKYIDETLQIKGRLRSVSFDALVRKV